MAALSCSAVSAPDKKFLQETKLNPNTRKESRIILFDLI